MLQREFYLPFVRRCGRGVGALALSSCPSRCSAEALTMLYFFTQRIVDEACGRLRCSAAFQKTPLCFNKQPCAPDLPTHFFSLDEEINALITYHTSFTTKHPQLPTSPPFPKTFQCL